MTTPYVTGTVSVTAGSAIVTGAGTGWQTAGLVAGVFGVDGLSVPVLSVDSDTKITLAKPWPGATASGKAYWITYDTTNGQQTVANAQMLALYLARLDKPALAALASLVPAADKLPYFGANGAGALADFNAAARALLAGGVLPDGQLPASIRSSALPVTASGALDALTERGWYSIASAGVNTTVGGPPGEGAGIVLVAVRNSTTIVQEYYSLAANRKWARTRLSTWGAWQLTTLPILGTVSQASGVPTGAIIERGSNANGEYVRFADGTQICWTRFPFSGAINIAINGMFRSGSGQWAYPVAFSARPMISGSYVSTLSNLEFDIWLQSAFEDINPNSTANVILASLQTKAAASRAINVVATGRWY